MKSIQCNNHPSPETMNSNHSAGESVLEQPEAVPPIESAAATPARFRIGRVGWVVALVLTLALIAGFVPRWRARDALLQESRELAVPTVTVISPAPGKSAVGVALP